MITQRMRRMAAAGILVTTNPAWAGRATQTGQTNWKAYRSPDLGFKIAYSDYGDAHRGSNAEKRQTI